MAAPEQLIRVGDVQVAPSELEAFVAHLRATGNPIRPGNVKDVLELLRAGVIDKDEAREYLGRAHRRRRWF